MTTPPTMSHREILRIHLAILLREHRDLDDAIQALSETTNPEQLMLKRLKKRKLTLKDNITRIQDELTPDIIA